MAWISAQGVWAQTNRLLNNSFEEAGENGLPRAWASHCTGSSRAFRDETLAHTGKACGHIVKVNDGRSHVAALVFPRVEVEAETTYTLSGWARADVKAGAAHLFLYEYSADGRWLGNYFICAAPKKTNTWTPLHITGKTRPDCAWVQIRFEIYGEAAEGEAWVDDVYFGTDTAPPPAPRQLHADVVGREARLIWEPPLEEKPWAYVVFCLPYPLMTPGLAQGIVWTAQTQATVPFGGGYGSYFAVAAVDEALNASAPVFTAYLLEPGGRKWPEIVVWTADTSRRWGPEMPYPPPTERVTALQLCRGEYGSLQIFVGAPLRRLRDVAVSVAPPRNKRARFSLRDLSLFSQAYVALTQQGRLTPDPLPPATPQTIEPGLLQGFWLLLHVPDDCPAGEYRTEIVVSVEGRRRIALPLVVHIWPVTIPRGNHYGGSWGVWGTQLAQQEQVPLGSFEYRRLYRRYLDFFLEHRMIPRELPADPATPEGAAWLNDERVASFLISTPAGWSKIMNEAQVAEFREQCNFLREKGWLRKGYIYNFDEPEPSQYEFCRQMAARIREAAPDVKILLTEQPEEALFGAVDIWCPVLPEFARKEQLCKARQARGEQVWWYVCLAPQPPWPNYLLINDPIDARALSWLQAQHSVEGELYWSVTCFPGEVWKKGLPEPWPGDGYLCYPGKPRGLTGPVTSIRAECIRDAKEDLELMWLLRQVAQKRGQAAMAEDVLQRAWRRVLKDFTHFSKREADYNAARRMIIEAIMQLQSQPRK